MSIRRNQCLVLLLGSALSIPLLCPAAAEPDRDYYKQDRAQALARVATTLPEGDRRREILTRALGVNLDYLIESGYEKTGAFANIVMELARAGFSADDNAIVQACKMMAKLNRRRVERDARSGPVLGALISAAERARAVGNEAWLELAVSLQSKIWDPEPRNLGFLAIALAQRALGRDEVAATPFAAIEPGFLGGKELAAQLAKPFAGAEQAFAPIFSHSWPIVWLPWAARAAGADLDLARQQRPSLPGPSVGSCLRSTGRSS
jgi:hypothetical protein